MNLSAGLAQVAARQPGAPAILWEEHDPPSLSLKGGGGERLT